MSRLSIVAIGLVAALCAFWIVSPPTTEKTKSVTPTGPVAPVDHFSRAAVSEAVLNEARNFERSWLTAKGRKDGDIAFFDYTAVMARISGLPDDDPLKVEAVEIGKRLKADEALIRRASDATLQRRQAAEEKEADIKHAKELLPVRRSYAEKIERIFLNGGMDVTVKVEGPDARTLRLHYVLMGRPTVFQVTQNSNIIDGWREVGFHTVIFTDGYRSTWTYDVRTGNFR